MKADISTLHKQDILILQRKRIVNCRRETVLWLMMARAGTVGALSSLGKTEIAADGRTTEPGFFARGGKRGDCRGAHHGIRGPAPRRRSGRGSDAQDNGF